jgi:hypothetical protein
MSQLSHALQQNPILKDFLIAGALVLFLIVFNIFRAIFQHGKKKRRREEVARHRAMPGGTDPIPGADGVASSRGWTGPSTDPRLDNEVTRYAHEMLRNLWGYPRGAEESNVAIAPENSYTNVYHGQVDGRPLTIGNTRLSVDPLHLPGMHPDLHASLCVLQLPMTLPPLYVNLHHRHPYATLLLKKVELESEEFNRTFLVEASDPKYATDVLTPQVMEVLLERKDWVFAFQMDMLVCLCATGLHSGDDYAARADALVRIAKVIPSFVSKDDAIHMPTLPDGTVLSLDMSEADQQKALAAFGAMSADEREEWMVKMQAEGLADAAKMFGKHLDPSAVEAKVREQVEQRRQEHPEMFEGPMPKSLDD